MLSPWASTVTVSDAATVSVPVVEVTVDVAVLVTEEVKTAVVVLVVRLNQEEQNALLELYVRRVETQGATVLQVPTSGETWGAAKTAGTRSTADKSPVRATMASEKDGELLEELENAKRRGATGSFVSSTTGIARGETSRHNSPDVGDKEVDAEATRRPADSKRP